jgi:hypothetical protein
MRIVHLEITGLYPSKDNQRLSLCEETKQGEYYTYHENEVTCPDCLLDLRLEREIEKLSRGES